MNIAYNDHDPNVADDPNTRFEDSCGVYYPFQKERNIPVECNSDESHTPGVRTLILEEDSFEIWNIIIVLNDKCVHDFKFLHQALSV